MMNDDTPTRDRLIVAAALLFRQKGYHGTGLAEILVQTGVPKGSLYHHFPNGKADLALAAAAWASTGMLQIIDDAFIPAPSYLQGATTFCFKLAKLFDISGKLAGCPVSTILANGPDDGTFIALSDKIFTDWLDHIAAHARRFGMDKPTAHEAAETLIIGIQGGWILARSRRNSDVIRQLPARLLDKPGSTGAL